MHEINREAARIARRVADRAGRPIIVAGSIGPSGELFEPLGALTPETATAEFAEQAQGLAEGGVDLLWIETMSAREEVAAAVAGAATTGLPFVTTMSFDTNGRTMMGLSPAELAGMAHELSPKPLGYGANCGTGAAELVAALVNIGDAARPDDVIIAKGNCGVPYFVESQIRYDGTPSLMADYARLARDAGARIIGGCCGTTPAHIDSDARRARRACAGRQTDAGRDRRAAWASSPPAHRPAGSLPIRLPVAGAPAAAATPTRHFKKIHHRTQRLRENRSTTRPSLLPCLKARHRRASPLGSLVAVCTRGSISCLCLCG